MGDLRGPCMLTMSSCSAAHRGANECDKTCFDSPVRIRNVQQSILLTSRAYRAEAGKAMARNTPGGCQHIRAVGACFQRLHAQRADMVSSHVRLRLQPEMGPAAEPKWSSLGHASRSLPTSWGRSSPTTLWSEISSKDCKLRPTSLRLRRQ